jgi:hypothetical protein
MREIQASFKESGEVLIFFCHHHHVVYKYDRKKDERRVNGKKGRQKAKKKPWKMVHTYIYVFTSEYVLSEPIHPFCHSYKCVYVGYVEVWKEIFPTPKLLLCHRIEIY